jgi:FtsH-binding integral membrane protein
MAYYEQPTMTPVINAPEEERAAFLVRVYQHLGLAVGAFVVFETLLFMSGVAERMYDFFARSGGAAWLLLLGGFAIANWFVSNSVAKINDPNAQYLGLFGSALSQSVIFAPFLYYVFNVNPDGGGDVWAAAIVTGIMFAALTVVAFVTRRDLSFLKPIVMWGFIAAIGLIIVSVIFGMQLGLLFSVAMVGLAGAAILYQTQDIVRRYPAWAYVGAAVALFGSLMTMFWYVLRIFSNR